MAKYPTTRETLILYQRIVQALTGQAVNEEENMEIAKHLVETPDNYRLAEKTVLAMDRAKQLAEERFLKELSEAIKKEGIEPQSDKFENVYTNKKTEEWLAITIPLGNLAKQPDSQIVFYIAVFWNVYYGFIVRKSDGTQVDVFDEDLQQVFKNYQYKQPAWRYPQSERGEYDLKIDFKHFNDVAIELIDNSHRQSYVKKLAKEIKKAIQEGVAALKRDGLLINEKKI